MFRYNQMINTPFRWRLPLLVIILLTLLPIFNSRATQVSSQPDGQQENNRKPDQEKENLQLFDKIVAVVNNQVITWQEMEIAAYYVLAQRLGEKALHLKIDKKFQTSVLEFLINQKIILAEAEKMNIISVGQPEVEKETKIFKKKFSSEQGYQFFLDRLGIDQEDIKNIILRSMWTEKYISNKVKLMIQIRDEEIGIYFEQNRKRFKEKTLEQVKTEIKRELFNKKFSLMLSRWIKSLHLKNDIRTMPE